MICFEVSVNGNRLCTAGVGEYGVLTAILTWVWSQSEEASPAHEERKEKPDLHVGGLVNEEHVSWLENPFLLSSGDVVAIKVISSQSVDEPLSRESNVDPERARSNRYFLYQQYKREFEGIVTGNEPSELTPEVARQLRRALYEEYKVEFQRGDVLSVDAKREVLRHVVATVAYRGGIAVSGAPENFAVFRVNEGTRAPGEILAHIADLLEGSLFLVKGELVYLASLPLPWGEEVSRFFSAAKRLDSYLASDEPLACAVEKLIQGPVGDALTHVGQLVMLRRMAGSPVRAESYFTAEIAPGTFSEESNGESG